MIRRRSDSGWRAASLAAALFAITLNFLQPLAHAALMRDGGPMGTPGASPLWAAMCLPAADQDGAQDTAPAAGKLHECCLGLAHAPVLAELSSAYIHVERTAARLRFVAAFDAISPVGIRDGPSQPRAPPSHV